MASIGELLSLVEAYRNTVANCERQINRLQPVYQTLGELKSDYRYARKKTESVFRDKNSWRGERKISFCRDGDSLDHICGEYYSRLDAAQDAVNSKIGELRAKKLELIPIINNLVALIEEMRTEIENALN